MSKETVLRLNTGLVVFCVSVLGTGLIAWGASSKQLAQQEKLIDEIRHEIRGFRAYAERIIALESEVRSIKTHIRALNDAHDGQQR